MGLFSGARLGRYTIDGLVGAGGMGEVYSAHDTALGRRVAVKVLTRERADPDSWRRFQREAAAGALLNHPYICTVFDVGGHGEDRFLVMEYVDGETLARRLTRGPLSIAEASLFGTQVAEALAYAHKAGVLHRDIKPSNIILSANGVKLVDFGLSRIVPDASAPPELDHHPAAEPITVVGVVMGTVAYMAPEQLLGAGPDHRADIYAFGAVLFEMFAGHPPFHAADRRELTEMILHREAPRLRTLRPDVPPETAALIQNCLAKTPEERVVRIEDAIATLQGEHTSSIRKARSARKPSAPRRIRSVAVLPFRLLAATADSDYLAEGLTELLIARLAGITGLRVISRTSVMQYRNGSESLRTIAARLKVEAIVEGSVLCTGQQLRITVHLIEVARDATIWAESYERPMADVLGVQSEIADEIARRIGANLSATQRLALQSWSRVPHEAQDAYLRARYLWNLHNLPSLHKSFEYYSVALHLAPDYALVHAGLADWYQSAAVSRLLDANEALQKGRAAAEHAIALNPRMGDPHASLGRIRSLEWDWRGAEAEFLNALKYNPNCVVARAWYASYLSWIGEHGLAIEHAQYAVALDPLNARSFEGLGMQFYAARRYTEAITQTSRSIEINIANPSGYYLRALARTCLDDFDEALNDLSLAEAHGHTQHPSLLVARAFVLHRAGDLGGTANLLERLEHLQTSPFDLAEAYAVCGRVEEALHQLEVAANRRAPELVGIHVDPLFDSIRSQPRFKEVESRVGIPTPWRSTLTVRASAGTE